jgi:CRP-like cAMP-binding protein
MSSHRAHIEHLRAVPLFQDFTRKDLEKIAMVSEVVTLPAGTTLIDEGRDGHEAFVVLSGTISLKRNGRKVSSLSQGAILGELSLLDQGPRTATAVAETESTVLVIARPSFLGVVDQVPALSRKLLAALASRLRDLDRKAFG